MPVDVACLELTEAQRRVAGAPEASIAVVSPPGCGKTIALAAHAIASRESGRNPLIVCSHEPGCEAFRDSLVALGADSAHFSIATFSEHVARMLRAAYLAAGVAPYVSVGGAGATRHTLSAAAKGLLDMSWPLFASRDINLDLPHLGRPDAFLDGAASLFTLLQRARVGPEEFEEGCNAGLAAFYGETIERAQALLQDPEVRARASGRGRDACRASAATLAAQKKAERDIAVILAQLYREYLAAAAAAPLRSAEDIVGAALSWFAQDERSAATIASRIGVLIVDDAEDAEPALGALVLLLRRHNDFALVLAGCEEARIDGFEGRRSALSSFKDALRIELPPLTPPAPARLERFEDEGAEASEIAREITALLAQGVAAERMAVLCRTTHAAALYATLLRERGVPAAQPSTSLEDPKEIADLFALCSLVDDPLDQEHLLRVLASPVVGLSDASLWMLCRDPADEQQLVLEVGDPIVGMSKARPGTLPQNVLRGSADFLLSDAARGALTSFRDDMTKWRARCAYMSAAQRFAYLAQAAGFKERWQSAAPPANVRLIDDLERSAEAVAQVSMLFSTDHFGQIGRLIEDEVVALRRAARHAGAILCESIVGVKGQRFEHVFVAGVAHERFPRIYTSHAMAFSRTYGLIVRENVARGAAQTAKYAWYYAKFGAKSLYLDEERRALSYGLSRGARSSMASGFGAPPFWARDNDLLAGLEAR